jgi:hypothetical protein
MRFEVSLVVSFMLPSICLAPVFLFVNGAETLVLHPAMRFP